MNLNDLIKKKSKKKSNVAGKVAAGLGIGAAVGVVAGTLLAPKAGKETREELVNGAKDVYEKAKDAASEVKTKVTKALEKQEDCCGEGSEEGCCSGASTIDATNVISSEEGKDLNAEENREEI